MKNIYKSLAILTIASQTIFIAISAYRGIGVNNICITLGFAIYTAMCGIVSASLIYGMVDWNYSKWIRRKK